MRKKSEPVAEINEEVTQLVDDMVDTMYTAKGVGLAAIQIGIAKRVIVINVGEGLVALINPEIIESEGEARMEEGCLCLPGVLVEITRGEKIRVKGINEMGKEILIGAEGLMARALQHEIDHLEGVLIIDKVSKIKRKLLVSKLKKEAKERAAAHKDT